jgi:hypothetical protein
MSDYRKARPPIIIDTPEGPREILRESGETLDFLYNALVLAHAQGDSKIISEAKDALFAEVLDYSGVPARKEANRRGSNLPGSGLPDGSEVSVRLDQLYGGDFREIAAGKVFYELSTFKGVNEKTGEVCTFHSWAYKVLLSALTDIVRKRMVDRKHGWQELFEWKDYTPGGKQTGNVEENRLIDQLDNLIEQSPVLKDKTPDQVTAAYDRADELLAAQSKEDQEFLSYKGICLSDGRFLPRKKTELTAKTIASLLNWPLKKVYNRTAKFKKMGLLAATAPNPQKRIYNRRARLKLAKSKSSRLSSDEKRA